MRARLFLYTFLSGLLFFLAWPVKGFPFLLFVAFVPLLLIQHYISTDNRLRARHLFFYSYLAFLMWNVGATWWVACIHTGQEAAYGAFAANSLLMAITFLIYHKVKRALPERYGTFALIPLWICFEFLHHDWDLTWPWLTLGNGFASWNECVQWYEFTGTFGGSFWILLINVLIFDLWIYRNTLLRPFKRKLIYISSLVFVIIFPLVSSLIIYNSLDPAEGDQSIDVVVIQPSIDPYAKFGPQFREHLEKMLATAETKMDTSVDYLVLPETALVESFWENEIDHSYSMHRLFGYRSNYPNLAIVTGAATGRYFLQKEKPTLTARKFVQQEGWYESYNTALQIDTTHALSIYHKSKLVPGSEKLPFPWFFGYFESFAMDLGGTSGSLGIQDSRTVFYHPQLKTGIAPVICYESIYGDYVGEYVRNGARFIFIMTNDGWWDDTPGYHQHLAYGTLRAIETRKSVARSANTGISCFINMRGDVEQPQKWYDTVAIRQTMVSTDELTFYTRHGDYIAIAMKWLTWGLILWFWVRLFRQYARKKRNKAA
jgi:apolipoprotein N-acyltransferase